jgi:hypothetical protein
LGLEFRQAWEGTIAKDALGLTEARYFFAPFYKRLLIEQRGFIVIFPCTPSITLSYSLPTLLKQFVMGFTILFSHMCVHYFDCMTGSWMSELIQGIFNMCSLLSVAFQ